MSRRYCKITILILFLCPAIRVLALQVPRLIPIPPEEITATASSEFPEFEVTEVINGHGMKNNRHQSQNLGRTMWLSEPSTTSVQAARGTEKGVIWLMFSFDTPKTIDLIEIWNHNQDNHLDRGLRNVYIQYSQDGKKWNTLMSDGQDYVIFPKATGARQMLPSMEIPLSGLRFKYLCITADLKEGNYYHDGNTRTLQEARIKDQKPDYYGLSEIRFLQRRYVEKESLPRLIDAAIVIGQGYRKSSDGPRREGKITFDQPLFTGATVAMELEGTKWSEQIEPSEKGIYEKEILLPPGWMKRKVELQVDIASEQGNVRKSTEVLPARQWTVYFLPHSHLDIGYTHPHEKVMELQLRNIDYAMELIEGSKAYPEDSRFRWNIETAWPLIEYAKRHHGTEELDRFWQAVREGSIGINAAVGNILTGLSTREELMHLFDDAISLAAAEDIPVRSVMMSDVPGFSWGVVTAMAENGILYFSMAPNYVPFLKNGGSRVGLAHIEWGDKPFYWTSQSGEERVLCWSAGTGYSFFHDWLAGKLSAGGVEPIWNRLSQLENAYFPYNITYFRYTVNGDNGPPDANMPQLIRQWNETYASPRFVIGTTDQLFTTFEKEYSNFIPSYSGDLTPYWEDGAASTARELAMNRKSSHRLNQLEIIYSLAAPESYPGAKIKEAWRNIALFSEHTWGASASGSDPESELTKRLWEQKRAFAVTADSLVETLGDQLQTTLGGGNSSNHITVFNTNTWDRTDVVRLQTDRDLTGMELVNGADTTSLQRIDNQWVFVAAAVPALGARIYRLVRQSKEYSSVTTMQDNQMENRFLKVTLGGDGSVRELMVRGTGHNLAAADGLNRFIHTGRNADDPVFVKESECHLEVGPVATVLTATSEPAGTRGLKQEYILFKELPKLVIRDHVDKTDSYAYESIRFAFPFNIENEETELDLPFSTIRPEREQLSGANKNFYSVQNGVTVTGLHHSVSLSMPLEPIVELGTMTGEEWMKDRQEFLAWKRQAASSSTIYSWVMNNSWRTNYKASQPGQTTFEYTITPLEKDTPDGKRTTLDEAQPLIGYFTGADAALTPPFVLREDNLLSISTMRPSEDGKGMIVRLVNLSARSLHNGLKWRGMHPSRMTECDNLEQEIEEVNTEEFWMKPHGVKTFKLWF